jgi:ribosomal RNA-processing protein 9
MSAVGRKRAAPGKPKNEISKSVKSPKTRFDFTLDDLGSESKRQNDDYIDSEDEYDESSQISSDDESEKETAEAKKIRMAREYLQKMEQDDDNDSSDASSTSDESDQEFDKDEIISRKLEKNRLKQQGLYERFVSSKIEKSVKAWWEDCSKSHVSFRESTSEQQAKIWVDKSHIKLCRGHDLTPTCVALHSTTGAVAYSASKDNSILMWDVESQTRLHTIVPKWNPKTCDYTRNSGEVLAMAASDDGRYLAIGGRDCTVKVYDVRHKKNNEVGIRGLVTTFEGHKGPVNALAFRSQSLQLFSGSEDRCIRHYNLEEVAYVETLYGHQAAVTGISCCGIRRAMPFSVARDRTARAWKLEEETHMIYRGGSKLSSADCISAIKDDWFLTGHDDGVLSLWLKDKKRPVCTIANAHGTYKNLPRGIQCCSSLGGSDFTVTGSNDGYLRLWNVSTGETNEERSVKEIGKVPIHGYINDIAIGPKGRFCVAAIGQEPRLGRWDRVSRAKNRFAIIQLQTSENETKESDH